MGLAALLDLATPALLRRRLADAHFNAEHLSERFGLFLIIALGEAVIFAIGLPTASAAHLGAGVLVAVVVAPSVAEHAMVRRRTAPDRAAGR